MTTAKPRIRVSARGWTRNIVAPKPAVPGFRAQYDAAGDGRRAAGWQGARNEGPVTNLQRGLDTIRRRCRHEMRNNPAASRIEDVIASSVIGDGLRPSLPFDDPDLMALFNRWSRQADAEGIADFFGLQELVMREVVAAGEVLGRLRPRDPERDAHLAVPLQLQLLPGEMLPVTDATGESVSGIIYKGPGRRHAYKFRKAHPGESSALALAAGTDQFSVVPAADVMHVYRPREVGQVRGEPWMVRGLIPIHDLDAYYDASLVRAKLNAMVTWWISTPNAPNDDQGPASYDQDENPLDENGEPWEPYDPVALIPQAEPGAVLPLPPGYKAETSAPAEVGGQFEAFTRKQMQRICMALSVPYELVSEDSTTANERMLRVKLRKFHALVLQWRRMVANSFCNPAWNAFVRAAVETGAWSPAAGRKVEDYLSPEWVGAPAVQVHPKQEAETDIILMQACIESPSDVIIRRGGDPEKVFARIAADRKRMEELGIGPVDLAPAAFRNLPTSEEDDARDTQSSGKEQANG